MVMPKRKSLIRRFLEGVCLLYFTVAVFGSPGVIVTSGPGVALLILAPVLLWLIAPTGDDAPPPLASPRTLRRFRVAARCLELLGAAYWVCALCVLPFVAAHSPRHLPILLAPLAFGVLYAGWAALTRRLAH